MSDGDTITTATIGQEIGFWGVGNTLAPFNPAWDAAVTSMFISLAKGNLTASSATGATGTTFARATSGKSTGTYYAEFYVTESASDSMGLSLTDGTTVPDVDNLTTTTHALTQWGDGNVYENSVVVQTTTGSPIGMGDEIDIAVNIPSNLIWFRVNNGDWNGNPSANPATNTGGLTYTAVNPVYLAVLPAVAGNVGTINFGTSGMPYVNTPPSGYGNWPP